jgi:glucose-6-phosphate 1-epimerase
MTGLPDGHGLETVTLQAADGARAVVALHGAHVVSWVPAGGQEMLYLSARSAWGPGQAIRGGVPVIFPQFSNRGPLVRHGFARVLPWQLVHNGPSGTDASAVLQLTDSAQTRSYWPHAFTLQLSVRLAGDTLALALSCRNTGATSIDVSAALHTYLLTDDVAQSILTGLAAHRYWDALDGVHKTQPAEAIRFDGELDRVYAGVTGELLLLGPRGGVEQSVRIAQSGFEDVVVWNPGAIKCAALADMPPDGWRRMVCVESAQIERPVHLVPGQCWVGEQRLTAPPAPRTRGPVCRGSSPG